MDTDGCRPGGDPVGHCRVVTGIGVTFIQIATGADGMDHCHFFYIDLSGKYLTVCNPYQCFRAEYGYCAIDTFVFSTGAGDMGIVEYGCLESLAAGKKAREIKAGSESD